MNDSEKILSAFSELYFYKELVLDNLHFTLEGSTEKEVADLLINGGDFIIAIQLKARNEGDKTADIEKELKWLTSKCKAAKKQVKDSIEFISSGELPTFKNGRNKPVSLFANTEIMPLIIFMNDSINEKYPHILNKHSDDGMDTNCMSFSDFQQMCRNLLSPMEIFEYLKWRLDFFKRNGDADISICFDADENVSIVRPLRREALSYQFVAEEYGLEKDHERQIYFTAFADMLHKLPERMVVESQNDSSYPLILFFAHFNRLEIKEFVERVDKALTAAKEGTYNIIGSLRNVKQKYVIVFVSTHDGYAFNMDFIADIAKENGDFDILMQVYCYWENNEEFRIDYIFRDSTSRYLKDEQTFLR